MRPLLIIPVTVFVALVGVFGYQLWSGHDPRAISSPLIGQDVPRFDLPGLPGRSDEGLSSDDLSGAPVQVVNFFASWCVPCIAEHPQITALSRDYGLPVHGITYNDAPADTLAWLRRYGDPYDRVASDETRQSGVLWGITGVPETYIIDAQGAIRFKYAGPITPDILEAEILPVIRALSP